MATFKAVVQKKRSDGTYPIYIRVTHNRSLVYLKTDMYVHESKVDGKKEIKDQV
ncbi:MAG: Arm DNA-binding domain-containing protein, partial [Parabacteroides gordonii]|uniref:Arm DNA-binding domain-containing protein n=1 Tax=Parabacteroides gordonii TaxID=574930 RepID=UPI003A864D3A